LNVLIEIESAINTFDLYLQCHSQSFGCGCARSPSVVLPFVFVLRQDDDKEIL